MKKHTDNTIFHEVLQLISLEESCTDNTYGTVNSTMLLRVCLSSMITAIWMKRSVRQPLG